MGLRRNLEIWIINTFLHNNLIKWEIPQICEASVCLSACFLTGLTALDSEGTWHLWTLRRTAGQHQPPSRHPQSKMGGRESLLGGSQTSRWTPLLWLGPASASLCPHLPLSVCFGTCSDVCPPWSTRPSVRLEAWAPAATHAQSRQCVDTWLTTRRHPTRYCSHLSSEGSPCLPSTVSMATHLLVDAALRHQPVSTRGPLPWLNQNRMVDGLCSIALASLGLEFYLKWRGKKCVQARWNVFWPKRQTLGSGAG